MRRIQTKSPATSSGHQTAIRATSANRHRLYVFLEYDTARLSQRQLANGCQVDVVTIINKINANYFDGDMAPRATIRSNRIVQRETKQTVRDW